MEIPRMDVLPDSSPADSDVVISHEVDVPVKEDKQAQTPAQDSKGSKTPEPNLYAALEEERKMRKMEVERRRELEQKLKQIELSSALSELDDNDLSEEGKALRKQLTATQEELKHFKQQQDEERVFTQYPQLRDKLDEFEGYKALYPGVSLDRLAKLFLVENDLTPTQPNRKGLEKPTSANKPSTKSGYSPEDIDLLRINQPRKFLKLLQSGEFDEFSAGGF